MKDQDRVNYKWTAKYPLSNLKKKKHGKYSWSPQCNLSSVPFPFFVPGGHRFPDCFIFPHFSKTSTHPRTTHCGFRKISNLREVALGDTSQPPPPPLYLFSALCPQLLYFPLFLFCIVFILLWEVYFVRNLFYDMNTAKCIYPPSWSGKFSCF